MRRHLLLHLALERGPPKDGAVNRPDRVHSARIATSGSTTAAFRAGTHEANAATPTTASAIDIPTAGMLTGSPAENCVAIRFNATTLSGRPRTTPSMLS